MLQSAGLMPLVSAAFFLNLLITFSFFLSIPVLYPSTPVFFKNCIFELVQVFNQGLVSTAKWHITSTAYRQCIKNYYLRQYYLLLFTNIRNVCKTKRNLIFVQKLVKIVSEDNFFAYVLQ